MPTASRGEELGLRWVHVDLNRGVIALRQQLVSVTGTVSFEPPKTAHPAPER